MRYAPLKQERYCMVVYDGREAWGAELASNGTGPCERGGGGGAVHWGMWEAHPYQA